MRKPFLFPPLILLCVCLIYFMTRGTLNRVNKQNGGAKHIHTRHGKILFLFVESWFLYARKPVLRYYVHHLLKSNDIPITTRGGRICNTFIHHTSRIYLLFQIMSCEVFSLDITLLSNRVKCRRKKIADRILPQRSIKFETTEQQLSSPSKTSCRHKRPIAFFRFVTSLVVVTLFSHKIIVQSVEYSKRMLIFQERFFIQEPKHFSTT